MELMANVYFEKLSKSLIGEEEPSNKYVNGCLIGEGPSNKYVDGFMIILVKV